MITFLEKILFLGDAYILKWGRFNATMSMLLGTLMLLSPLYIMSVLKNKADEIALLSKIDAGILSNIELFDSHDEFLTIAYELSTYASLIEKLPEMFSVLLALIGFILITNGVQQLKLHRLIKEKEEN